MKRTIYIFFLFSVKIACAQFSKENFKDFKLITDMMDSVKNLHTIRFNMKSLERIDHGFSVASTQIKLQLSPRKLYLKNPEKKLEILYDADHSKTKCYVKPHIFPYFTMQLEPNGNLMRKDQHFTINEVGFDFAVKTIAMALSKEKNEIAKHLSFAGVVDKNGMKCHLVIYENTNFGYYDYTVKSKETVTSIAYKLIVNDYMIRTKNKLYDNYGYLKTGSVIKIPTFYCKKAVFYIDEKSMLPISITIYDEVGIFENYEYYNLDINKPIDAKEFTKSYKGYGF